MSQKANVLRGKTPVQLLQEMAMKMKSPVPAYQYTGETTSPLGLQAKLFTHSVAALGKQATGVGRTKQDSKHEAAWQLLRVLLNLPPEEEDDSMAAADQHNQAAVMEQSVDRVSQLRDICIQRNFPLPEFELVRSFGPSHAPSFEYEVRIRDIVRRGTHSTKKGAKQIACQEMIKTLQAMPVDDTFLQVVSIDDAIEEEEQSDDHIIKTYYEYSQSDNKKKLGVSIADRHRFFLDLPSVRIAEAHRIMMNGEETVREKCHTIPTALGLKFKITPNNPVLTSHSGKPMHTFELLNSEYDCFIFKENEDTFYKEVYQYFCLRTNFRQVSTKL
ncbi:double-stranded RNA-binding protein Staufen homolog isoform X2 [Anopheles coustani]|uniref:double-stranded RNA-binding protein Staufen homolog isoform X2 n=1 Tax=Anopheles coustani TaxID=139045 RepID=UPI00265A6E8F|nr:double-stranded RNA-binding protein Staufen homolog isoform X2 [Anopheles coustani]